MVTILTVKREAGMAQSDPGPQAHPTDRLVGHAPALQALRAQICHLATFDTVGSAFVPTLLLDGETGTGKGLVARVIHDKRPTRAGALRRGQLCCHSGDAAGGGTVRL